MGSLEESRVLRADFYARPVLGVAEELLGKYLVRRREDGTTISWPIHEVEAYDGTADLASHASRGMTPRNAVMFGAAGCFYVYLCYGIHWLLNIVTGPVDYPAAVLIRGAGPYVGPARLTKGFGITGDQNKLSATETKCLWVEDRSLAPPAAEVERTARIGVDYAGPEWAGKPYRFVWNHADRKTTKRSVKG